MTLFLFACFIVAITPIGIITPSLAFPMPPIYHLDVKRSWIRPVSALGMVSDLFLGGNAKKLPQLPRDVKDAVSKCREATQAALRDRISRMDIEFPVGTKFGIEKIDKKRKAVDGVENKVDKQDLDRSDRELARIFIEMFQPVGGENIAVVFCEEDVATAAKKQWGGDASAAARIVSMNRRKSLNKVKKSPKMGFAAKLKAEVEDESDESGPFRLPSNTEVAIFVAPGPKELIIVERICAAVGMGTLVILLNARLSSISNFGSPAGEKLFRNEFQPVFSLSAANQLAAPGCLMHSAYGKSWILARKPKVGPPETILFQESRPTNDECTEALKKIAPLTEGENIVQNAALNIANWFR